MSDITDYKIGTLTDKITDLSDRPNETKTATALKAYFDSQPEQIRAKFDALIDYLLSAYETKANITTNRKLSAAGDFTGTLNGYPITAANPAISAIVAGLEAGSATGFLNVKGGYGADPTGVADSTAAVQSAIDAATATTGIYDFGTETTLWFPKGTYKISSLTIAKNLHIEGNGAKFICTAASNSIAINMTGGEVLSIRNLTLESSSTKLDGLSTIGIKKGSPAYMRLENVKMKGFSLAAIQVRGGINSSFRDCYFDNNNFAVDYEGTTLLMEECYMLENVRGFTSANLTDSQFNTAIAESNTYGFHISNAQRCTMIQPYCEANVTNGIYLMDSFVAIFSASLIGAGDTISRNWSSFGVASRAYTDIDSFGNVYLRHLWMVGDTGGTAKELTSSGTNNENLLYDSRPVILSQSDVATASYQSELALYGVGASNGDSVIVKAYGTTYTATKTATGVYRILFGKNINQPCVSVQVLSASARWVQVQPVENNAGDWDTYRLAKGLDVYIYSDAALSTHVDDYVCVKITVNEL